MARQERNNVDYFPHPVNHGKTMFYMRSKYGNDGYAVWFILLEKLANADYHYLDLKDEVQLMFLSSELKVTEEVLIAMIIDLVKMRQFDSELWENEMILFNEKLVESIADAYKKRNNSVIDKITLELLLHSKGRINEPKGSRKPSKSNLKGSGNTQRIEEDRIEKKTKVEIPTLEEFVNYAKQKKPSIDTFAVKCKWEAWVENNWKDGNNNKIVNWKSKLTNTLPYIREQHIDKRDNTDRSTKFKPYIPKNE